MVITSQDMNLMDLDISWIWPDNVPAFQTKMAFVLHDAQCRDQKRDHWFIDHHNDMMVPVETFWRWTFSMAICRSYVYNLLQTFWITRAGWMDDSDSSTIFSISSSKGPSRAVEQPRDVSPRRQEGTWRGKTTWESHLMCKYVKGDKGRRVTREMLLLWKLDEVV